jgi:DNA-binding response OmpR family regulator
MFPDKVRVLVIEDNEDSREMLCLYLTLHNFEVVPVDNSEDALRLTREQEFDAYLIDNRLPELSGIELCKRIRQFNSHTPIVFYSGDRDDSHKDEAFQSGAQGYVVKPASCEDVLGAIIAAIEVAR